MASDRDIPTNRLRRTAKIGGLVTSQGAKHYGTRVANLARSEAGAEAAWEERHVDTARQIVETLGTMKGAAMKIGQVASFLDTGALPPGERERYQQALSALRNAAPSMDFEKARRVLESELEEPLEDVFDSFEEEAVAAASIGQVHRAVLPDGRRVAVKVQYPGIDAAVRSDMQNLGLLMRLAKRIAPGIDAKAMAAEVRERVSEELDYELEAQAHRVFARRFRGHPFIHVPPVVTRLSRQRVLVTEWVDGEDFDHVKGEDQATRDRFGEIVFRFFFGSLYRDRHFSGDPHPGNFLLMPDGRVCFLDFGMIKTVDERQTALETEAFTAVVEGDAETLHGALAEMGFLPKPEEFDPERLLAHLEEAAVWLVSDTEFQLTPDVTRRILITGGDPRSEYFDQMKRQSMPANAMLARRMEAMVLGVLGQVSARANWHRIGREYWYADPPATALGEAEQEFFSGRRVAA